MQKRISKYKLTNHYSYLLSIYGNNYEAKNISLTKIFHETATGIKTMMKPMTMHDQLRMLNLHLDVILKINHPFCRPTVLNSLYFYFLALRKTFYLF